MRNLMESSAMGWRGLVLRNALDAGGAGGPSGGATIDAGPAPSGDGGVSTVGDDGQGQVPGGQSAADTEPDPFDSDVDDDAADHEALERRDPRLSKKLRKLANRDRVATPVMQALRAHGIDPRDRKAVATFLARAVAPPPPANAPAPPPAAAAPKEPDRPKWTPLPTDEKFDASAFSGWDANDPSNKALIGHMERGHRTAMQTNALANAYATVVDEVIELRNQVKELIEGGKSKDRAATSATWASAVKEGADQIRDPEIADRFRDAVMGAAMREKRAGRNPDAKAIVAMVLKGFQKAGQVTPREAARVTAAAQGIADRNRTAPSRAALAPNGPAGTPSRDRSQERVGDVSRRLVGRHYYSAR